MEGHKGILWGGCERDYVSFLAFHLKEVSHTAKPNYKNRLGNVGCVSMNWNEQMSISKYQSLPG